MSQKQASRTGTSIYIPQILWDVITSPCPWYLPMLYLWCIYEHTCEACGIQSGNRQYLAVALRYMHVHHLVSTRPLAEHFDYVNGEWYRDQPINRKRIDRFPNASRLSDVELKFIIGIWIGQCEKLGVSKRNIFNQYYLTLISFNMIGMDD